MPSRQHKGHQQRVTLWSPAYSHMKRLERSRLRPLAPVAASGVLSSSAVSRRNAATGCSVGRMASRLQLRADTAGPTSMFTTDQYLLQKQSEQRAEWAASVRTSTSSRKHEFWEPQLDPPPLLADVVLVVVSPRRPVSLGTVARAASCFEVGCIRVVQPRCDYITRHSKNASKGAQYMLFRAQMFDSVAEATADCDLSVAFTRWVSGRANACSDLSALLAHTAMQGLIRDNVPASSANGVLRASPQHPGSQVESRTPRHEEHASQSASEARRDASQQPAASTSGPSQPLEGHAPLSSQGVQRKRTRVALVFGREELGLSDDEVDACSVACSIPIGRLQESLSLSHAVSIVLSGLYAQRLAFVSGAAAAAAALPSSRSALAPAPADTAGSIAASGYVVTSVQQLAEGYDISEGAEQ